MRMMYKVQISVLAVALCLTAARTGFAACETDGSASAAASSAGGTIAGSVSDMAKNLKDSWLFDLGNLHESITTMVSDNSDAIMGTKVNNKGQVVSTDSGLTEFGARWLGPWNGKMNTKDGDKGGAWTKMAGQLSAGITNQSRQLGAINDANNLLAAARAQQKARLKSTLQYQPTEQACRFDTTAVYIVPSRAATAAYEESLEREYMKMANNQKDSGYETGAANLVNKMWERYHKYFCDVDAENGHAYCDKTLAPAPGESRAYTVNMDVLPGKMLFHRDTIELLDDDGKVKPGYMDAIDQMTLNLLGHTVPPPMMSAGQGTIAAMGETIKRRQYMTQMATAGSLFYSLLADRVPGPGVNDPALCDEHTGVGCSEIYKFRKFRMGDLKASKNPSKREIRQTVVEQLWDPAYYKDLYDTPGAVAQKELYLKAYSLVMLNDMIAKQEKISNVYAMQTSMMLGALSGAVAAPQTQPVRKEVK